MTETRGRAQYHSLTGRMADSEIVMVGPGEIPLVTNLYNEIFRPPQDKAFFERRLLGRYNKLLLVANIERQPVGFALGFELKPSVFFGWLLGVLPSQRRQGVASQLLEAMTTWAAEHEYHGLRMRRCVPGEGRGKGDFSRR